MHRVLNLRHLGLGLTALLITAAAYSNVAIFTAAEPGSSLEPVAGADVLVDLVQGQEHLLWSTLSGTVATVEVIGWPSADGDHELGGAVMLEKPADGTVGVIDFGEKPMSARFYLSG